MSASLPWRRAAVLVARSAIAASPQAELQVLADHLAARPEIDEVAICFTDYGRPSLRETMVRLGAEGCCEVLLLPLLLPLEPAFRNWLARALERWRESAQGNWPLVRVAPVSSAAGALYGLVDEMTEQALLAPSMRPGRKPAGGGDMIPAERRRALICQDYPCNNAGSAALWPQLRAAESPEVACSRTSCLGPCGLGPVVQVFPEGTYYCGVDEAALDRIIGSHLKLGEVAEDLAYLPTGKKQHLRRSPPGE